MVDIMKSKVDIADLNSVKPTETVRGTMKGLFYVNEPHGFIALFEFPSGKTTEWMFHHEEIQYVLGGEAEITYSLPPMHLEWKKTTAKKGDIYLVPNGAHLKFKVTSKEPYTHLDTGNPSVVSILRNPYAELGTPQT